MGLILDACYTLAAAAAAPWWLRKKRAGWRERFGRIEPLPAKRKPRLLVHAVSLGEVNLLRQLVPRLAKRYDLVVSATTDTGFARATELYAQHAHVARYPLDFSRAVGRFLDAVDPDYVALVELELWPNFAQACRRRAIPVGILNGRLSERSFKRYRLIKPFLWRSFSRLAFVAAQSETYQRRFVRLGVREARCSVAGSMKWDAAQVADSVEGADELALRMGIDRAKPLIVAGSTAPDEHHLLHVSVPPGAQLLCAPRRPEWFDHAADEMPRCVRWSTTDKPILAKDTVGRFLLDTMGMLRTAYALADVVVVGRSFGKLYGSDPMEPAALAKAVVIGPSVADFRDIVADMLEADAIIQTTRAGLPAVLADLCDDAEKRAACAARAQACVRHNQGSTDRHLKMIEGVFRTARKRSQGAHAPRRKPRRPARAR